ncbi:MAG: hypothetical protein JSR58_01495 [Verrucomicrobia bacterium]|nr:hypothetical protein [Verrucomicrobiota bacterium]
MRYILIILTALSTQLSALYLGNPAEPQVIDEGFFLSDDSFLTIKLGYQGDFVYNRKMRAHDGVTGRIDRLQFFMNQGVATFNVLDRFEYYISAGSLTSTYWHRPHVDKKRREVESHDKWTLGTGARLILFQWGDTILGVDAKYQYSSPHFKWATVDGTSHDTGAHMRYWEWQVGAALSYTVDVFTPYIGATYSVAETNLTGFSHNVYPKSHFHMRNVDRFGMAVGCTLSSGKKFDLTLEARMISEQAVTAAANVKF